MGELLTPKLGNFVSNVRYCTTLEVVKCVWLQRVLLKTNDHILGICGR